MDQASNACPQLPKLLKKVLSSVFLPFPSKAFILTVAEEICGNHNQISQSEGQHQHQDVACFSNRPATCISQRLHWRPWPRWVSPWDMWPSWCALSFPLLTGLSRGSHCCDLPWTIEPLPFACKVMCLVCHFGGPRPHLLDRSVTMTCICDPGSIWHCVESHPQTVTMLFAKSW